jgi:hypothetical protein
MIPVARVFLIRLQARGGPKGISIEFVPVLEDGDFDAAHLPGLQFLVQEPLAQKLAEAIVRQLDEANRSPAGETLH